jgi:hypothetical protein
MRGQKSEELVRYRKQSERRARDKTVAESGQDDSLPRAPGKASVRDK